MQSQISQRKTHTIWYHLYVGSKKHNKLVNITTKSRLTDIENKWVVTTEWERQYKDGGGEVHAIGYKAGSRMYCITRGIQPTFCNNGQWKVTFKKDIKILKLFFNWKKEKKKSNGLLITPASGPRQDNECEKALWSQSCRLPQSHRVCTNVSSCLGSPRKPSASIWGLSYDWWPERRMWTQACTFPPPPLLSPASWKNPTKGMTQPLKDSAEVRLRRAVFF